MMKIEDFDREKYLNDIINNATEEICTSFRVMKMTRTVFENKSGDQYTKDSV